MCFTYRSAKPAVIAAFADIAMAVEGGFVRYLDTVLMILQSAAAVSIEADADEDLIDYMQSLRESILEAYTGILQVNYYFSMIENC